MIDAYKHISSALQLSLSLHQLKCTLLRHTNRKHVASVHRKNGKQQYKAAALDITIGKQEIEECEGSTQIGKIRAAVQAAHNGAKIIHVDSYTMWACDT